MYSVFLVEDLPRVISGREDDHQGWRKSLRCQRFGGLSCARRMLRCLPIYSFNEHRHPRLAADKLFKSRVNILLHILCRLVSNSGKNDAIYALQQTTDLRRITKIEMASSEDKGHAIESRDRLPENAPPKSEVSLSVLL